MIYFWRILTLFAILNLINIQMVDGGAGMEIVWVVIILGSTLLSVSKIYQVLFSYKLFKGIIWVGFTVFIGVEILIIGNGLSGTVETGRAADYLIVLGARVRGETPSLALQYRLDKAYDYLIEHPSTIAIVTGGKGVGENITEAEAMSHYLQKRGIPSRQLLLEDKATDTVENLKYSFALIKEASPKVIVVTSSFHVLRSKMIAKDLGKTVYGIGAKTLSFLIPTYYLREFFAVIVEYFV